MKNIINHIVLSIILGLMCSVTLTAQTQDTIPKEKETRIHIEIKEDEFEEIMEGVEEAIEEAMEDVEDALEDISEDTIIDISFGNKNKDDDDNSSLRIGMLDLGISTYLDNDNNLDLPNSISYMDQRLWRSINVGIHIINYKVDFNPRSPKHKVGISTGIKWNIVHYSLEQDYNLLRNQESYEAAIDYEVPVLRKNRLKGNYLQIPFLLEYNSNSRHSDRSINLGIGYVHQFLLQSNYKYKTEEEGIKQKTKGDFNLTKSMGMIEGRLGVGPLNFYVQYGLKGLFQVDAGPELTAVNFGLNIIPR